MDSKRRRIFKNKKKSQGAIFLSGGDISRSFRIFDVTCEREFLFFYKASLSLLVKSRRA